MSAERDDTAGEPTLPPRTALLVCAALLVLSGLSIALAHVDLGGWNTLISLLIAAVQAILIGAFSMRIRYTAGMPKLVSVAGLFWLAILMVGTLDDVLTRGSPPTPGK
jgi:caa(3)-type oxidase subunit IV